jgi:hypothetical protein
VNAIAFTASAVVISLLVATAVALLLLCIVGALVQAARHRSSYASDPIEASYQAARRDMNDAAGQSWRNIID